MESEIAIKPDISERAGSGDHTDLDGQGEQPGNPPQASGPSILAERGYPGNMKDTVRDEV